MLYFETPGKTKNEEQKKHTCPKANKMCGAFCANKMFEPLKSVQVHILSTGGTAAKLRDLGCTARVLVSCDQTRHVCPIFGANATVATTCYSEVQDVADYTGSATFCRV